MFDREKLTSHQIGFLRTAAARPDLDVDALCRRVHVSVERVRRWLMEPTFVEVFRGARFAHRDELDWRLQIAAAKAVRLLDAMTRATKEDPTRETRRRACVDLVRLNRLGDARFRVRVRTDVVFPISDEARAHPEVTFERRGELIQTLRQPPRALPKPTDAADGAD